MSISASAMIGISLPVSGTMSIFPTSGRYRPSSGFTATAVSPSIVSGRVVAIVMEPVPSANG